MIKAKEMRETILRNKCDKDKITVVESLVNRMLEERVMVLSFSKEDPFVLKNIEALFHCKKFLECIGYNVYENAWEVRLEC